MSGGTKDSAKDELATTYTSEVISNVEQSAVIQHLPIELLQEVAGALSEAPMPVGQQS